MDSQRQSHETPPRVLVALWMNGVFGQEVVEGIHEWLRESDTTWRIRFADSERLFDSSLQWMMREKGLDGVISHYHSPPQMAALPGYWLCSSRI